MPFGAIGSFLGNVMGGDPYEGQRNALLRQLQMQASGQGPSLAGMQLQQGLGRLQAQQQGLAAGARPGQQALAHRLASQNMASLGTQMNAQAAQLRLAEQQQAQQALMQALMGFSQIPTTAQRGLGALQGIAQIGSLLSDKNAKTNIRSGKSDADKLIAALAPQKFRYRDERNGEGRRLGIVAQAIEKVAGARHAVVTTPQGKQIDTTRAFGPIAAAIGRLGQKVADLERKAG